MLVLSSSLCFSLLWVWYDLLRKVCENVRMGKTAQNLSVYATLGELQLTNHILWEQKKFVINYIEEGHRAAYHNFEIFVIGLWCKFVISLWALKPFYLLCFLCFSNSLLQNHKVFVVKMKGGRGMTKTACRGEICFVNKSDFGYFIGCL